MELNDKQKDIINLFLNKGICFVNASAGTGKTTTITQAYLELLEKKDIKVSNIVVITFTKAAANEMLIRIRTKIRERINSSDDKRYWQDVYKDILTNAKISTIHSFANSIVKEYAMFLGMPPNISILEDNEEFYDAIRNEILYLLDNSSYSEEIRKNYRIVTDDDKDLFVNNIFNFLLKIKPRLETIEKFEEVALSVVDIEEYNKAYNDMLDRINVVINTNTKNNKTMINIANSIDASIDIIKKFKDIKNIENKMLVESLINGLNNIISNSKLSSNTKYIEFKSAFDDLKDVFIKKFINQLKFQINKALYLNIINFIKDSFNKFELIKKQMGVYSHEDMISKAIDALKNKDISRDIRENIKALILDEAQDTSKLQYFFINLIVFGYKKDANNESYINSLKNIDKKVLIVGDRKQSIYRFRNADLNEFLKARNIFKDYVKYLQDNYRSKSSLINFFNDIFENVVFREDDTIKYEKDDNLVAQAIDNKKEKLVSLLKFNDNTQDDIKLNADYKTILEAYAIANFINTNFKNDYKNIVILLQTFKRLNVYLSVFAEFNIPYYVDGGNGFYERVEICNIVNFLKYLVLKDNSLLQNVLMSEFFDLKIMDIYDFAISLRLDNYNLQDYFSLKDTKKEALKIASSKPYYNELKKAKELLNNLEIKIAAMSAAEMIETICYESNYYNYLMLKEDAEIAYANIEKLKKIAYDFENRAGVNAYDFVLNLDANYKDIAYATVTKLAVDAVRIMTVHKSKGLEFDKVILAGAGHYINAAPEMFDFIGENTYIKLPMHTKKDDYLIFSKLSNKYNSLLEQEEKKRLLYVALTRAKEKLIISGESKNFKIPTTYRNYIDCYHIFEKIDIPSEENNELIHIDDNTNEFMDYYSYGISINKKEDYDLFKIYEDNLNLINKKRKTLIQKNIIDNIPNKIDNIIPSNIEYDAYNENIISILLNKKIHTNAYDNRDILDENEIKIDDREMITPVDMGTLMHDLLEYFDFDLYMIEKEDYLEKLKNDTLKLYRHYDSKDLKNKLDKYFTNFLKNEHIQNIFIKKEIIVSREHKFQYRKLENGKIQIINAKIDIITKNLKDEYFILDYKTTKYTKEKELDYKKQIDTYKNIVKDTFNIDNNLYTDLVFLG